MDLGTRIAAQTIDGTTTSLVFDVRSQGTAALQTVSTSSLAFKVYVSMDGGTTYAPIVTKNSVGSRTPADTAITASITVIDYVLVSAATHMKITRTAGSGTVAFSAVDDPALYLEATSGSSGIESNTVDVGGVATTVKFASVAAANSGDNQIVAAVTSKKIRVLSYVLVADAAEVVQWQDASGNKSGTMSLAANGGIVAGWNPNGWFETTSGERLDLNNVGGADVDGHLSYVEV